LTPYDKDEDVAERKPTKWKTIWCEKDDEDQNEDEIGRRARKNIRKRDSEAVVK